MSIYAVLADALRYPSPGQLEALQAQWAAMPRSAVSQELGAFVGSLEGLTLAEWEELHTRTLDLGPLVAPYIGWQIWGENYKRGEFLAQLNRALSESHIELEGELPDHLRPVLRYLDTNSQPLPELVDVLSQAVRAMCKGLHKSEPENPYNHLFEAIRHATQHIEATS